MKIEVEKIEQYARSYAVEMTGAQASRLPTSLQAAFIRCTTGGFKQTGFRPAALRASEDACAPVNGITPIHNDLPFPILNKKENPHESD